MPIQRSGRQNKLTASVGEYLVAAELARRGLIATTFTGNVPDYDIIATDGRGRHVSVQVKTSNSSQWQFNISNFCEIQRRGKRQIVGRPARPRIRGLTVVLVRLSQDGSARDQFFICSWKRLRDIIISGYRSWLDEHGGIRPKNPNTLHTIATLYEVQRYEDRWDMLHKALR